MKIKSTIIFVFLRLLVFAQAPPIAWQHSYGGSSDEVPYAVCNTKDGGYILAGFTQSNDEDVTPHTINYGTPWDYWVTKIDAGGNLQWQKLYGGDNNDVANDIKQTRDNGYIIAGFTSSYNTGDITNYMGGSADMWLVKTDSLGNILWQKTYGGFGEDGAQSVQLTPDGGYVLAGFSTTRDTLGDDDYDYLVIKTDSSGNVQWQKYYGGTNDDTPYCINQTTDKGFIVVGYSTSGNGDITNHHGAAGVNGTKDYWAVKTDSAGNLKWQKSFGGTYNESASVVLQENNGTYLIGGWANSTDGDVTGLHGAYDYWVINIDTVGNFIWQKCYGGAQNDQIFDLEKTVDNGFIMGGITYSNNGNVTGFHGVSDFWVVKTDTNGIIQWQKTFGGSGADACSSLDTDANGGYVFVGSSSSNDGDVTNPHGSYDFWAVKLNCFVGVNSGSICNSGNQNITLIANGATNYTWLPADSLHNTYGNMAVANPTGTTIYTVTGTAGSCTAMATSTVTVNHLPIITVSNNGPICINQTVNLYSAGGVLYNWSGPNLFTSTAQNPQITNASVSASGTYVVLVTDTNNCSGKDSTIVTVNGCTDIQKFSGQNEINIYPNPSANKIIVQSKHDIKAIKLTDMLGNEIENIEIKLSNNEAFINADNIITGIYFITITGGTDKFTKKIVISR